MTYEEYLAFERSSPGKHEFVNGHVFAMAGGRFEHNQLAGNVHALLWNSFRGRPCRVNNSDQRVLAPDGTAHYPDVTALCGDPTFSDDVRDELLNPTLIVEVLSDSTEAYDRGKKFEHYATIPSFSAYVLIATDRQRVEIRERSGELWTLRTLGPGERFALTALGCELAVDDIYANVVLAERA
jgi:Uma2 family endonuclease